MTLEASAELYRLTMMTLRRRITADPDTTSITWHVFPVPDVAGATMNAYAAAQVLYKDPLTRSMPGVHVLWEAMRWATDPTESGTLYAAIESRKFREFVMDPQRRFTA